MNKIIKSIMNSSAFVVLFLLLSLFVTDLFAGIHVCGTFGELHNLYLYNTVKSEIYDLPQGDWYIQEVSVFVISRAKKLPHALDIYEVYVEVRNDKTGEWTNDWVLFTPEGIVKEELTKKMSLYDRLYKEKTTTRITGYFTDEPNPNASTFPGEVTIWSPGNWS